MSYELEQLANNAITTLSGGINSAVTSLVLASATGFPTRGVFRILIDTEILKVTAISGTTCTVVRGDGNTTAASHSNGATIVLLVTKESILALLRDAVGRPLHTYPLLSDFAWINQGIATIDDTDLGLYLKAPTTGVAASSLRIQQRVAPSTPYVITAKIVPTFEANVAFLNVGIGFRENSSGKLETLSFAVYTGNDLALVIDRWNSPTSFNANLSQITSMYKLDFLDPHLRIRDDGTSIYFDWSNDGYQFVNIRSELRGAFFTTAPSHCIFFADANNTTKFSSGRLLSWAQT